MQARSNIQESNAIRDLLALLLPGSWVVLDLDNTIVMHVDELGRDQWFGKMIEHACQIIPDNEIAIASVVAIYNEVQHHAELIAVEQEVVDIIKRLQANGRKVIGLTARGYELRDVTIAQLAKLGIDFKDQIIFCNGGNKGAYLEAYLKDNKEAAWPPHIVMVDDKGKHLEHVQAMAFRLGIAFDGLRYGFLDEVANNVDMHAAHGQLLNLQDKLSSSSLQIVEELRIAHHYSLFKAPVKQDISKADSKLHSSLQH